MINVTLEIKELKGGQLGVHFKGRGDKATQIENHAAASLVSALHELLIRLFGSPLSVVPDHQDENQEKPENQERKENNDGRTPNPPSQAEP